MVVRLSHLFMIVSNVEAQVRLLVDVVGLELLVQEEEYVRVGGSGGFYIGRSREARPWATMWTSTSRSTTSTPRTDV
jgi:hypothetical protein